MALPLLPMLLLAGGAMVLLSKRGEPSGGIDGLVLQGIGVANVTVTPNATPVPGATGGSTRPGHSGPSGRQYKAYPTPGYWYRVRREDMYPIIVRAKHGSIIGILIDDPFAALAWRAYTPNVVKMGTGKPDLSGWVGLNPVLGGVQQLDDAFDLADEGLQAIVGGFTGRFDKVAKNAAMIIQSVWKGIREKQDAANGVVFEYLVNYAANIASDPANSQYFVDHVPPLGFTLRLEVGDAIYIPQAGVYYPRESTTKPNN